MENPVTIGNAQIYCGDCLEVLRDFPKVDHVITDPPFDAEAHTQQRRALGRGSEDGRRDIENAALPFPALTIGQRSVGASRMVAASNGWLIVFCQAESVGAWREAIEIGGGKWRRAMVWIKPDGMPQFSGDRPGMGFESIAAAWCGEGASKWNGGGKHGVFTFPKSDGGQGHGGPPNEHPTQKPQRLMRELVSMFSNEGETILDPYAGSGSTGVACMATGRKFIGIEREPTYFAIACERIENAQRQERMFP